MSEDRTMASTTTTASVAAPIATTTVAAAPATSSNPAEQLTLSTIELQLLSEIDSQQFGFLKLNDDGNIRKRAVITKAIKYLERFIVRARERQRRAQVIVPTSKKRQFSQDLFILCSPNSNGQKLWTIKKTFPNSFNHY